MPSVSLPPLSLDRHKTAQTLSQQVAHHIRTLIRKKILRANDRLPASRELAKEFNISRGTATTAIEILVSEGVLETKVGAGVFISADAHYFQSEHPAVAAEFVNTSYLSIKAKTDQGQDCLFDLRPCRPSTELLPRQELKKCFTKGANYRPSEDYGDPRGSIHLREAISNYLRRARGLNADPDEIIITNGAVHAMNLLAQLYLKKGAKVIVENPGYQIARQSFEALGAQIIPCNVDDDGLCTQELEKITDDITLIYVTPSHQFPVGSMMSLSRRRELIEWAIKNNVIIIEDDYDGEFRFDVPPVVPLAAMANNCVYYCGTFSKVLFPGIRMGYAVAPKPIIDALANLRTIIEYAPSDITQMALYHFISEGHFEKHILRMRREYAKKRATVVETLAKAQAGFSLKGLQSGLHGLLSWDDKSIEADDIVKKALQAGIVVPSIHHYDMGQKSAHNGLVLGYSAIDKKAIIQSINIITQLENFNM